METQGNFQFLGEVVADDRARLAFGKAGVRRDDRYAVAVNDDGEILLTPLRASRGVSCSCGRTSNSGQAWLAASRRALRARRSTWATSRSTWKTSAQRVSDGPGGGG